MAKCKCRFCTKIHPGVKLVRSKLKGKALKFFDEFSNEWLNVSDDLNHKEAVLSGDWPNSVQILERALERAKLKAKGS